MFGACVSEASLTERAWAAGFFDAEGCTTFHVERSGQRRLTTSIPQSGHGRLPEVLLRFRSAVASGAIYGPFPNGSHTWHLRGAAIIPVIALMWPWLGPVKRGQFDAALGAYNNASTSGRGRDLEFEQPVVQSDVVASHGFAWAAGLFDGDGSTCNSIRHLKGGVISCGIKASVSQGGPTGVPEVLERFQSVVGFGRIYPSIWRNAVDPGYDWTVQAYRDVRRLRDLVGPFVGPIKAAQMDQALVRFEQSPHRRKAAFRPLPGRSNLA